MAEVVGNCPNRCGNLAFRVGGKEGHLRCCKCGMLLDEKKDEPEVKVATESQKETVSK